MTTENKELHDYLNKEVQKEVDEYRKQLMQDAEKEIEELKFVGTPEMQEEHRQNVRNKKMSDIEEKILIRSQRLEAEHFKHTGGSREQSEKIVEQDKISPEFNEVSSETRKYDQEDKLIAAKESLNQNWKDATTSDPQIDMDK